MTSDWWPGVSAGTLEDWTYSNANTYQSGDDKKGANLFKV